MIGGTIIIIFAIFLNSQILKPGEYYQFYCIQFQANIGLNKIKLKFVTYLLVDAQLVE